MVYTCFWLVTLLALNRIFGTTKQTYPLEPWHTLALQSKNTSGGIFIHRPVPSLKPVLVLIVVYSTNQLCYLSMT